MDDIPDLINKQIKRKFINNIYTTLPAKILNVNNYQSFQTVDVQPTIDEVYEDGVVLKLPVLYNVPVILLGGGGALFSIPLVVGDTVLVAFCMKDIDRWKVQDGSNVIPDTNRQHSINDAVAIPGLFTSQTTLNPDPADVVIKFQSSNIKLKSTGKIEINSSADIDLNTSGNANVNAAQVNLGTGATERVVLGDTFLTFFNNHTHPTAGIGAPSKPSIEMSASQLSANVKVKS